MQPLEKTRFTSILEQLIQAERALDGVFAVRAKTFVDAGNELIQAVSIFRELISVFEGLPAGLENEDLNVAAKTLEDVAIDCTAIQTLVPEQISAMEALTMANAAIGERLEQLRQNMRTIATIAIKARIEASTLKSESEKMLTFTYDVGKLATAAETTINSYSIEQRKSHEALSKAKTTLSAFASRHRNQLGEVAIELRRNLSTMDERRSAVITQSHEIGECARKISHSVSIIITALQISDITSQRLAHVHEAVTTLIEGLSDRATDPADASSPAVWWSGLTMDERSAVAAEVAMLQIGQIENALADMNSETASVQQSLSQLVRDAAAMTEQGSAAYGSGGSAGRSFLGDLASKLQVASRLLSDCETASRVVDRLNESVAAQFTALQDQTGSIQGIVSVVSGVKLISLNAHLKSDGLGAEGRTLSAISKELRNSAEVISVYARELMGAMAEAANQFENLRSQGKRLASDKLLALERRTSEALSAFEKSGTQVASALTMLSARGENVRKVLRSTNALMTQPDDLDQRLAIASRLFRTIGCSIGEKSFSDRTRERTKTFFAQRYTMAAERNVHIGKAEGDAAASTSALADPNVGAALDDIFF